MSSLKNGVRTVEVYVRSKVVIEIQPGNDALDRVTGPGGDEWRTHAYGYIKTPVDACLHWAYNAVQNGTVDACELDGWADLEAEQVTMRVVDVEAEEVFRS